MTFDRIVLALNKGEKIYNLPLRVTYYARVSTESDVQLNSLENQLDYYERYIKEKNNWTYVDGYVEQGVTGVSVDKRVSFKQMIKDAQCNKFDLIITKEVSRFARDLEDSIHYIRKLKCYGVGVYFENQGMNTFDVNSELTLNILFNLAQEESRKLSSRIKFGHKRAIEKGHVLGSSNITGYKKDNCKLVIVKEEAKFIKKVFELYSTGKYGFYKLAQKLSDLGYLNKNGKIYDKDTLKRIIENPKYKGYYRGHTFEIMDYRTKRRNAIDKTEQIIYKCKDGSIPAIVSEELWDKANEILEKRTMIYKNNNCWSGGLKYPFSSKIYCKKHNSSFQRIKDNRKKNRATWSCNMYLKYRLNSCHSPIILEQDLYNIFELIMDYLLPNKDLIIKDILNLYNSTDVTSELDEYLSNIQKDILQIESKKNNILDLVFDGYLKKEQLKFKFEELENMLKKLYKNKNEIIRQKELVKQRNYDIYKLIIQNKNSIKRGVLESFIRKFVYKIMISKINDDRHNIHLDIFLNLPVKQVNKENTLYLENCTYETIENKRKIHNRFTYDVYFKTI